MSWLAKLRRKINTWPREELIVSPSKSWPHQRFETQLRGAHSAQQVRKLWYHYASHQQDGLAAPGRCRKDPNCFQGLYRGLASVIDHAGAWNSELTHDVLRVIQRHERWHLLSQLARQSKLTSSNIVPLLNWANAKFGAEVDMINTRVFELEYTVEEHLIEALTRLAERELIPEGHPLRERLTALFQKQEQVFPNRHGNTSYFKLHSVAMLLGDLPAEYVREERDSLRQKLEDEHYSFPLAGGRMRKMYRSCLQYLCQHDTPENFACNWQYLDNHDSEQAMKLLQQLAEDPPETLEPEGVRPLLHHPNQEVRQQALRLLGRRPAPSGRKSR